MQILWLNYDHKVLAVILTWNTLALCVTVSHQFMILSGGRGGGQPENEAN